MLSPVGRWTPDVLERTAARAGLWSRFPTEAIESISELARGTRPLCCGSCTGIPSSPCAAERAVGRATRGVSIALGSAPSMLRPAEEDEVALAADQDGDLERQRQPG